MKEEGLVGEKNDIRECVNRKAFMELWKGVCVCLKGGMKEGRLLPMVYMEGERISLFLSRCSDGSCLISETFVTFAKKKIIWNIRSER